MCVFCYIQRIRRSNVFLLFFTLNKFGNSEIGSFDGNSFRYTTPLYCAVFITRSMMGSRIYGWQEFWLMFEINITYNFLYWFMFEYLGMLNRVFCQLENKFNLCKLSKNYMFFPQRCQLKFSMFIISQFLMNITSFIVKDNIE